MYIERLPQVTVTTVEAGTGTGYSNAARGEVRSIRYIKPGSDSYENGVDLTVTNETTGEVVLQVANMNASAQYYPLRTASLSSTGAAIADAYVRSVLALDRLLFSVSSGGSGKAGTFEVEIG